MCGSDVITKRTRNGLGDLFCKTKGDTSATLTERAIAIRKLMRASVANAGSDSCRGRLTPVTIRANKSNKIVNMIIDFWNTVGITRRDARFIRAFCEGYCLFDGQQNHAALTT
jgi:hypothetical protein